MDIRQLLDEVPHELRQRGLPEAYIARYVDELREHVTDLIQERTSNMSKDARSDAEIISRIGPPDVLADAASAEFARRGFCGRHPIIAFVLAPVPLAVFAWVVTFATLFGCGAGAVKVAEWLGRAPSTNSVASWPAAAVLALTVLFSLCVVVPPAALNALLCRLAYRNGLSWRWSLAGCLMVAVIAGLFQASLIPAATADGRGRMMLGFGLWLFPPLQQWLQFALPLTVGLGLLWRQTHRHRNSQPPREDVTILNRQAA